MKSIYSLLPAVLLSFVLCACGQVHEGTSSKPQEQPDVGVGMSSESEYHKESSPNITTYTNDNGEIICTSFFEVTEDGFLSECVDYYYNNEPVFTETTVYGADTFPVSAEQSSVFGFRCTNEYIQGEDGLLDSRPLITVEDPAESAFYELTYPSDRTVWIRHSYDFSSDGSGSITATHFPGTDSETTEILTFNSEGDLTGKREILPGGEYITEFRDGFEIELNVYGNTEEEIWYRPGSVQPAKVVIREKNGTWKMYEYNDDGSLFRESEYTDYGGTKIIQFYRDENGNIEKTEQMDENENLVEAIRFELRDDGKPVLSRKYDAEDRLKEYTEYEYRDDGQLLTETTYAPTGELAMTRRHEYDELGREISWANYSNKGVKRYGECTEYDESGNITRSCTTSGDKIVSEVLYYYDVNGNPVMVEQYSGGKLIHTNKWEYNNAGLEVKAEEYENGKLIIGLETLYDEDGKYLGRRRYDSNGVIEESLR